MDSIGHRYSSYAATDIRVGKLKEEGGTMGWCAHLWLLHVKEN